MSALANASRGTFGALVRFLTVGVLNSSIGLGTIFALKWIIGMSDVFANALGYAVGLITSYFLNGRWTFLYQGSMARAAPRFALTVFIAYLTNLAVVMACIDWLRVDDYLAHALGVVPYTTLTFLGTRYFVFSGDPPPPVFNPEPGTLLAEVSGFGGAPVLDRESAVDNDGERN